MTQPVFDLVLGDPSDPPAGGVRAGWSGGDAPAIGVDAWPRSTRTGFPMIHLLTIELPPAYRRRGEVLVGIALFQADDHVAKPTPGAAEALTTGVVPVESAFHASLARAHANRHPEAVDLRDMIDGQFTLIWLRASELAGHTAKPVDDRESTSIPETGQNLNAWDHAAPASTIFLVERPFDPNAGKAPIEAFGDEDDAEPAEYVPSLEYVDVVLTKVAKLNAFYEAVHGRSHLGGTCLPVQSMPEGLTPWFLELEDGFGGANFGGGNMQLDLESGVFDWAC